MPRWTRQKSDEVRTELVTVLGLEGGRVALGNKTSRWFLDNVTSLKGTTTIAGILGRMERDGVIVLERGKGEKPVIMGVSLPHLDHSSKAPTNGVGVDTGGREAKREIQEAEKAVAVAEPVMPAEPAVEEQPKGEGLANLIARIEWIETRTLENMAVVDEARKVIAYLQDPPEEFDETNRLKVERDEAMRQLEKIRKELAIKNGTIERAQSKQRKAEKVAADAERTAAALAKNLKTTMDLATRTGKKVRDLLAETQRREIERLMSEVPTGGKR